MCLLITLYMLFFAAEQEINEESRIKQSNIAPSEDEFDEEINLDEDDDQTDPGEDDEKSHNGMDNCGYLLLGA